MKKNCIRALLGLAMALIAIAASAQLTYSVVDAPSGIRVYSSVQMVTNPGSAFARTSGITDQMAQMLQRELEELQANLRK